MKILHTADWHLGARRWGLDRTDDQLARVDEILAACEERQADWLVVAGDVFDVHRGDALEALLRRLGARLRPHLDRGLQVLFLAGNHDREHLFPLLREAGLLFADAGRVIFCDEPQLIRLQAKGEAVQALCLPYPTQGRYGLQAISFRDGADRRGQLKAAVERKMAELAAALDPSLPVLIAGHFLVRGYGDAGYELSEEDDIPVEEELFPPASYVALGHIHRPARLKVAPGGYPGPIERMDFGEAEDIRSAWLAEISGLGPARLSEITLAARPLALVQITLQDELSERLQASGVDAEQAIVKLRVLAQRGEPTAALVAQAKQMLPNLALPVEVVVEEVEQSGRFLPELDQHNLGAVVRSFLEEELEASDPDRQELLERVERLLASQQ